MRNEYSIKFVPLANKDLNQIYYYISEELLEDQMAIKVIRKIESSIMRLKNFPLSCRLVEDDYLRDKGYRKLVVDSYIVFYLVNESQKQVIIMRILNDAQKYQNYI